MGSLTASQRIHDTMANRVLRAPCGWFESTPLGRIVNRFSSDLLNIDEDLMSALSGFQANLWQTLAVVLVVGGTLPWLLLPMAVVLYFAKELSGKYLRVSRETKRLDSV
ncbi:unnamed protein product, partial [Heterosigma akashiwo]